MLISDAPTVIDHSVAAVDQTDGDVTLANLLTAFGIAGISELVHTKAANGWKNKLEAEPCSSVLAADSGTKAFTLWAGVYIYTGSRKEKPVGATLAKLGTGTVVIGTHMGITDGTPDETHRFGDTLVWTQSAYYADLISALGAADAGAHSPADNTIAKLTIGEVGFADFVAIESITGLKWRVRMGA